MLSRVSTPEQIAHTSYPQPRKIMLLIALLLAALLTVVISYTFIYILFEMATVCVLVTLAYARRTKKLPGYSCVHFAN